MRYLFCSASEHCVRNFGRVADPRGVQRVFKTLFLYRLGPARLPERPDELEEILALAPWVCRESQEVM